MRPVYCYSIGHPRRVVAIAVLLTMAVAPGVMRLRLRTDGNALLPTDASEIRLDRAIRDDFGVRDQIAVVIEAAGPDGVFNFHTLDLVREWTRRFAEIEGIGPEHVVSLATEKSDRYYTGTLRNRGFLDPPPATRDDLANIRDDVRRIRLYTGTLAAYDDSATAILVGVPADVDRTRLHGAVRAIIDRQGPIPERVHVVGAPVAESLLGTHILEDLGVPTALLGDRGAEGREPGTWRFPRSFYEFRVLVGRHVGLVPIAVAIMGLVFLVSFRGLVAAMLPLGEVGACLIFVFGMMGWCGVPVYLTIAVLPVILTAMGIADEIHIFSRYRRELQSCQRSVVSDQPEVAGCRAPETQVAGHVAAVETTMGEMWRPVVKTSLTTAIALLSFVLSPIAPVRAFGIFTAAGIIFCMVWSLTVIPACLALIDPRRFLGVGRKGFRREGVREGILARAGAGSTAAAAAAGGAGRPSFLHRMASAVVRFRYVVLLAGIVVVALAPFGVRRVRVQDSWIDGFAPDSDFYQATQLVNERFHGTHILLVCVDTGHRCVTGHVPGSDVDHYRARLPVAASVDPGALVGQWLCIRRPDPPAGDGSEPAPSGRAARFVRIVSAVGDGETVEVKTNRRDGSMKPYPPRPGDETLSYEISGRRLLSPEMVALIGRLESFIETHRAEAVGGVVGTADYITTLNYMTHSGKEDRRRIPDNARDIRWLWGQYRRVLGDHRLREIIDADHARGLITVFMEDANYVATRRLMHAIRDYERSHLAPHGVSLTFAGDVAVSQALIGAIVTTQVRSLLLSLLGILAITAVMGGSAGWGVYCAVPCCLAVLVNFAVMGAVGMPLGVATSMFSAMTLGIGVDFAIHLTERYRLAARQGLTPAAAVVDAVTATGPAVALDALAIALGFGVMILSQVPSNARLGGLVVLSVVGCLAATLLLLPALLAVWRPAALDRSRGLDGHAPIDVVSDHARRPVAQHQQRCRTELDSHQ